MAECEPDETREPLEVTYDAYRDILTINGMKFSGELFRVWGKPPLDHIYKFQNRDNVVTVEQVVPCLECRLKFHLGKKCRECGCTPDNACRLLDLATGNEIPCSWVEEDLCSGCRPPLGQVRECGPLSDEALQLLSKINHDATLAALDEAFRRAGIEVDPPEEPL